MRWFRYIKDTASEFSDDSCPTLAASLAFYAVLSLPPLLLLIIQIAGAVYGQAAVQNAIQQQVTNLMGGAAAGSVQGMVQHARGQSSWSGPLGVVIGIVVLAYSATAVLAQLQLSLNRAWDVQRDANSGVMGMVLKRIASFGLILLLAAVLLVSLVLSAMVARIGGAIGIPGPLLQAIDFVVTMAVIAALIAVLFKYFPDAQIDWHDVLAGAILTSVLFVIGKFLLGYYLGHSNPGGGYGAAGSLVLILVWIYYSSMIFLFGAEFTQVWARAHGSRVEPSKGAVRVNETRRAAG